MKVLRLVCITCVMSLALLAVVACNNPGTTTNSFEPDPDAAAAAVEEASTDLEEEDLDSARTNYGIAVNADPQNGEAQLGYSLMEVLSILIDSDIVDLAHNNLGLEDYPSNLNDLIVNQTWIIHHEPDTGDPWDDFYAPTISGESDWVAWSSDDDNPVDIVMGEEKLMAFIDFFVHNNTGFNEMVGGMSDVLETRINAALSAIDNIPADTTIVFPGELTELENPLTSENQDLVIGKAEANLIAANLLALRSMIRLGQVYDYSLPSIDDYFDNILMPILEGDEPSYDDPTPFSGTFLGASDEAATKLAEAKADMQSMIDRIRDAIATIEARDDDTFSLSSESSFVVDTDDTDPMDPVAITIADNWDAEYAIYLDFFDTLCSEVDSSLDGGGEAYLPIAADVEDDYANEIEWMEDCLSSWPDSTNFPDSENTPPFAIGIDLGAFYSSPICAINVLFDLQADGEPVFYVWDGDGGFEPTTTAPAFEGADPFYYVKVNDISFNGTIDTSIFPRDTYDPADVFCVDYIEYDDVNEPWGKWDHTESITELDVYPNIGGAIDIANWGADDPASIYCNPDVDFTTQVTEDELLDEITIADGSDITQLQAALNAYEDIDFSTNGPVAVITTADEVYFMLPMEASMLVAHSLIASGDELPFDLDNDGTNDTSTGSFWWGIASLASMME